MNCLLKDNIWSNFMDFASGRKIRTGSVLYDIKIAQSLFMSVVFYLPVKINLLTIKLVEMTNLQRL